MTSTVGNTATFAFIKNWTLNPNVDDFDIDRIDSAKTIRTKKSDILGAFDFTTKNTTEIYDGSIGALNEAQVTYWVNQIALGDPVEVDFIVKVKAADPNAVGNTFVTYSYKGRIEDVNIPRVEDTGVHDTIVSGPIIDITSFLRTAS